MYGDEDPRRLLTERAGPKAAAPGTTPGVPRRSPVCYEFGDIADDARTAAGSRTWVVRGEQVCIAYSDMVPGDSQEVARAAQAYILISVDPNAHLRIVAASGETAVHGCAVVVVPRGASTVTSINGGDLIRVFDVDVREIEVLARNRAVYTASTADSSAQRNGQDLASAEETRAGRPEPLRGVRVYDLDGIEPAAGRFGRIFRTETLMVNVMFPQVGPRDPAAMSPHSHATFDQCSITVRGDHVHHLRTPWTPVKADWRPDRHLLCHSPSITVIPAGIVHTTEQVGDHEHLMIDAFAPPRADFLAMPGWVLNADEYDESGAGQ